MGNGYMGKILVVDLTAGEINEEIVPDTIYHKYSSGVGLAAHLLYDRIPQGADPLGPDNILGFVSGLLTGSRTFFTGRWMAVGKSPLTGGWGDANSGGRFSYALKRSGYDGIFFKGVSSKPVYLSVVDGVAKLADAEHIWGMDTTDADDAIKKGVEGSVQVAVIGPAGEKLSLISGIVTDKARIAARSGLGAVMGSKRLKGLAVGGSQKITIARPDDVKALNADFKKWFDKGKGLSKILTARFFNVLGRFTRVSPIAMAMNGEQVKAVLQKFGTVVTNVLSSENGDSPVMNWKGSGFKDYPIPTHANNLNPQRIIEYQEKSYHCYACPLGCGGKMNITDGRFPIGKTHKVEYETCCAFGPLLLNNDLHSIFKINDMLNRAGMDTISAGATVAWAMECFEQGLLTLEDVDGLDLSWGRADDVIRLVEKMIARKGIGDKLADGSKVAARRFNRGEEYTMQAGGQELAMHDTRFDPGFAISYALEPTPGRHTNHGYQWLDYYHLNKIFKGLSKLPLFFSVKSKYQQNKERSRHLANASNYMQFVNSVGGCLFGVQMGGNLNLPAYTNAVTGWNYSPEYYLEVGERIQNLRQSFNIKHGIRPLVDFALPERAWGKPPVTSGPLGGITLDINELHQDFLRHVGWDEQTAVPSEEKLKELGLQMLKSDFLN